MKMELSEKLSALILASEVIKNVGIHADHETRQKASNELMERLSGALSEMDGTPTAAPAAPDTAEAVAEKPKPGRKSERSKKPAATQTDDSVEEKVVTEQAVKAAEEPTPEPVVEELMPEPKTEPEPMDEEPVAEEPVAEPEVEEPVTEEPVAEEPVAEEQVTALDYDKDVAPAVRAAAAADRGRTVDLLKAYGATRATEVKEEDWPVLVKQMLDIAHGK